MLSLALHSLSLTHSTPSVSTKATLSLTEMLSYVILPLAMSAVSLAAALPHGLASSSATWCQNLGGGAFDTASNFTIAAYDPNSTGAQVNATGTPVVLTETGTDGSASHMVFATYASHPDNTWGSFSLNAGALIPISPSDGTNATDLSVNSGDVPAFAVSSDGNLPTPAQAYCAVANTDPEHGNPYPVLAVNTNKDSFALCQSASGDSNGQTIVVYEAHDDNTEYDFHTCFPIQLYLIGLD